MSAGTSEFFCLICLLLCSCTALTNIRHENITAELGENATLPCKALNININIRVVEWSRPEMEPDHVLLYRYGHFDPYNQHPYYQNRVELQDKEMKDGDVSLILKNVTKEDTGTYECRVFEKGNKDPISIINLEVLEPAQTNITAKLGQDVILPSKAPNKNISIHIVEWRRPDLDPHHVFFYQDGRFNLHSQHPSYQNRVDLQDKEMKDGDISLVLMNVTMEDTGTYKCRVSQGRKNELISIIILEVHPPGGNVGGHKGGIIGGSVVGVMLLAVLASVGFWLYKRHTENNTKQPDPPDEPAAIEMLTVPEHHQNQVQLV